MMMARAKRIYILIAKVNKFSFFSSLCFLKEAENMFFVFLSSYSTLVKVWENSKKLWKHSPAARVPPAFLILPNFHLYVCFYNSIETRYMLLFYFLSKDHTLFLSQFNCMTCKFYNCIGCPSESNFFVLCTTITRELYK